MIKKKKGSKTNGTKKSKRINEVQENTNKAYEAQKGYGRKTKTKKKRTIPINRNAINRKPYQGI